MTAATFHVYGDLAYRSEIALYRAQGVDASAAEQVAAPSDVTTLWRVEIEDEPDVITDDGPMAFMAIFALPVTRVVTIDVR